MLSLRCRAAYRFPQLLHTEEDYHDREYDEVSGEIIHAQAPMAKMFGFSTNLRSATQGRASFSMEFSHFQIKVGGLNNF